jgi:RNA polymerase sigma factor (sigma-70 family)
MTHSRKACVIHQPTIGIWKAGCIAWHCARHDAACFACSEISSEDSTLAVLQRLEVGRLLVLLTERQRAIVVAHYYLGLSQEEIAEALGVRRGTVSATVSQSLARMREGGAKRA